MKHNELEKEVVKQVNVLLKKKHLRLVFFTTRTQSTIKSQWWSQDYPVGVKTTKRLGNIKRNDFCGGWTSLESMLFKNSDQYTLFQLNSISPIDEYVAKSMSEIGLTSLDGCNSYEEMLLRLAILKGSER